MMDQHTKTLSTHLTVERSCDRAEWGRYERIKQVSCNYTLLHRRRRQRRTPAVDIK